MTPVLGIRSVVLYVSDPEAHARFWVDQLGLRQVADTHGRIELDVAGTRLLLHPTDLDEIDRAQRHGRVEVYLLVDNLDQLVADLARSGVVVVQPPTDEPWGERDAVVLDPEGNPVFLTQRLG